MLVLPLCLLVAVSSFPTLQVTVLKTGTTQPNPTASRAYSSPELPNCTHSLAKAVPETQTSTSPGNHPPG